MSKPSPLADATRTYAEFLGMTPEDLFWHLVKEDPSGCWIWQGNVDSHGYGRFYIKGSGTWKAHRLAMQFALDRTLAITELVCHHCDVPLCVNPDHLYIGTAADNARDRFARNRSPVGDDHPSRRYIHLRPRGERHGMAKITDSQASVVKRLLLDGHTQRAISEQTGVSLHTVRKISSGKQWTHVAPAEPTH